MSLDFPFALNAIKLILVMIRIGVFIYAFPLFSGNNISNRTRIFLILIISIILMPLIPEKWGAEIISRQVDLFTFGAAILMEVILGAVLSLVVGLITMGLEVAGLQFGRNMGFYMAKAIDPATGVQTNVISVLFSKAFIIIFFVLNFHQELIRLAAYSFTVLGPGQLLLDQSLYNSLTALVSEVFLLGFMLSIPIFGLMMLVNISLGFMARVGQDFPVLMLAFPIRIGLGLIILQAIVPTLIYFCRLFAENIIYWMTFVIK